MENKTIEDAIARVNQARIGSLIRPTGLRLTKDNLPYLYQLRQEIYKWLPRIEEEIARVENTSDLPAHGFGGHAVPGADY